MTPEQLNTLVDQIAELRASQAATTFILLSIIENMTGVEIGNDSWIRAYDALQTKLANVFENKIREGMGIEPRPEPRDPVMANIDFHEAFAAIDWDSVKSQ
jgi:hypothetical protein